MVVLGGEVESNVVGDGVVVVVVVAAVVMEVLAARLRWCSWKHLRCCHSVDSCGHCCTVPCR